MLQNRYFLLLAFFAFQCISAQVKIGSNPNTIDSGSIIELESNNKALVLTRLTNTQMVGLTPLRGALVFNTDTQCVHFYDSTQWVNLCSAANSTGFSFTDNGDGTITLANDSGGTVTFDGAPETISTLVDNSDGTYTYTNENGTQTIISSSSNVNLNTDGTAGNIGVANGNTITLNVDDADADNQNEIQSLQFSGGVISLTNDSDATIIDLSGFDDDVSDDFSGAFGDLTDIPTNLAAVIANTSGINTGDQDISGIAVNATDIDALEAEQMFRTTPSPSTPQKRESPPRRPYTAGTPDVEAHLAGIDAALAAGGGNPTDEIQDLAIAANTLTITNNAAATPINLAPYLDNTDAQTANLVPVANAPLNYTAGTPDVEAHLAGIDAALAAGGGNPTDEIQDLAIAANTLTITNNAAATPINLAPYLDNTDAQTANLVPVANAPLNYTAGTPDVEAHLAGIDAALGGGSQNLFNTNGLTLTANRNHNLGGNNFVFSGGGNIGIGTLPGAPQSKLDVDGQVQARLGFAGNIGSSGNPSYGFYTETNMGMYRAGTSQLAFSTNSQEAMRIIANGSVGIGVTAPLANLHVAGDIRTDGNFFVGPTALTVPDYVFQKYFTGTSALNENYKFQSLQEIENFVKQNEHLPGVKAAAEIKEQGFWNLGEASRINLEKIEELFLHTIEQEKKIKELQSKNESLSEELESLKKDISEIKVFLQQKKNE